MTNGVQEAQKDRGISRSFEEHLKAALIPGRLYIRYKVLKEKRRGEKEISLIPLLSDPRRVALDIGANKGVWAEMMRPHARTVHAFEPNPKMFAVLRSGAAADVQIHCLALSDHSGESDLLIPKGRHGYSNQGGSLSRTKIGTADYATVAVQSCRLDDLDELHNADIGFMKIDVEGHELAVLNGAEQTLRRCRPNLIVEMEEAHTKRPIQTMIDEVCGYGYRAYALDCGVLRPVSHIDLTARHTRHPTDGSYIFNWIFLPV